MTWEWLPSGRTVTICRLPDRASQYAMTPGFAGSVAVEEDSLSLEHPAAPHAVKTAASKSQLCGFALLLFRLRPIAKFYAARDQRTRASAIRSHDRRRPEEFGKGRRPPRAFLSMGRLPL